MTHEPRQLPSSSVASVGNQLLGGFIVGAECLRSDVCVLQIILRSVLKFRKSLFYGDFILRRQDLRTKLADCFLGGGHELRHTKRTIPLFS